MRQNKRYTWQHQQIINKYKLSYVDFLKLYYIEKEMSAIVISEMLTAVGIKLTPRSLQRKLKQLGIIRTVRESFKNAIKHDRIIMGKVEMDIKPRKITANHFFSGVKYIK